MKQKMEFCTTSNSEKLITSNLWTAIEQVNTLVLKGEAGDRITQTCKIYGNQKLPNYGSWMVADVLIEDDGKCNWLHSYEDEKVLEQEYKKKGKQI